MPLPMLSASHAGGVAPPQHGLTREAAKTIIRHPGFLPHRAAAAFCADSFRCSGVISTARTVPQGTERFKLSHCQLIVLCRLHHHLINVAPKPVLARLEGLHD